MGKWVNYFYDIDLTLIQTNFSNQEIYCSKTKSSDGHMGLDNNHRQMSNDTQNYSILSIYTFSFHMEEWLSFYNKFKAKILFSSLNYT